MIILILQIFFFQNFKISRLSYFPNCKISFGSEIIPLDLCQKLEMRWILRFEPNLLGLNLIYDKIKSLKSKKQIKNSSIFVFIFGNLKDIFPKFLLAQLKLMSRMMSRLCQ